MKYIEAGRSRWPKCATAMMQSGDVQPIITAARAVIDGAEARDAQQSSLRHADRAARLRLHRPLSLRVASRRSAASSSSRRWSSATSWPAPIRAWSASIRSCRRTATSRCTTSTTQMKMFAFFHQLYPKIHLTTHAGELVAGHRRARGSAQPHPRLGDDRQRGAHRPRRRSDVRR